MDKRLETAMVILVVCALGLFVLNQILEYRYKVEFLKTPCSLCAELNKNQSMCINGCFQNKVRLFSNGLGDWCGDDGFKYDSNGIKKEERCNLSNYTEPKDLNLSNIFLGK